MRWWVRLLCVAVPLAMAPFVWYQPWMLNPEWRRDGMPASEWWWAAALYVVMGSLAWSAFRSRIKLGDGRLRVVNPWRSHEISTAHVIDVKPGSLGVEFLLSSGRIVSAFAVQCTAFEFGAEPRWVDVAREVTAREPA
ncbi:hypothetical protein ACFQ05_23940 [Amycolatopsis umgeniensis]|uniref:Uncharacterized protein n=1 Tax=Amycolatopsis umgeniensis TaxID=336628 RepID=A0A841ATE6_9PSEU|nr:hypothetical protein [Amycolatopsis umgeniensis]MBB5850267.1 hypothetical protein [Amycolatopsis umgeniensis]